LRELSLHLLDIAENSISAGASRIVISVREDLAADELWLEVSDNGKGMSPEMVEKVLDPFVTSRTTRKVGLGIPLLKQAAEACNGFLTLESEPGKGTKLTAKFQHSHIDRMPLGNLGDTIITLILTTPAVNWVFRYQYNDQVFEFDDTEFKEALGNLPLSDFRVIKFLSNTITEGVREARNITTKEGVVYANY
jgi:anti-sigma regulatory factor (Ser/Thr protein kinase)